jgi:hypothetical protein
MTYQERFQEILDFKKQAGEWIRVLGKLREFVAPFHINFNIVRRGRS